MQQWEYDKLKRCENRLVFFLHLGLGSWSISGSRCKRGSEGSGSRTPAVAALPHSGGSERLAQILLL
jgi:hypothetical protein